MRENDKEEEFNSSSKNFMKTLSRIDTNRSEQYIELEDRNPRKTRLPSSIKRDSQTSFDRALLYKVRKEEEEENLKKRIKEQHKIISQVRALYRKDYIVFFFILISSAFNFNYLFLPFVIFALIYFFQTAP